MMTSCSIGSFSSLLHGADDLSRCPPSSSLWAFEGGQMLCVCSDVSHFSKKGVRNNVVGETCKPKPV